MEIPQKHLKLGTKSALLRIISKWSLSSKSSLKHNFIVDIFSNVIKMLYGISDLCMILRNINLLKKFFHFQFILTKELKFIS